MAKVTFLNGSGDLAMDKSLPIWEAVQIIKETKSGLIQIMDKDNKFYSVPKRNLEVHEICTCDCHIKGRNIMHFAPCCDHTYEPYLNEDGSFILEVITKMIRKIK